MRIFQAVAVGLLLAALLPSGSRAEILAMMNYESKTADSLKSLKLSGSGERREGIAIIDVDPNSESFGRILVDIPMPSDQIVHHLFYDRTMTKTYITSLGSPSLQVIDMQQFPYRVRTIDTPGCEMAEDVIFDERNERWFLTCMNSANVFVGDVASDKIIHRIDLPGTYPHGLGVNDASNRILVTSTVSGDLQKPDEIVTVLDATTYKDLGTKRLSLKDGESGEAPVEILFAPGANPPVAYVTNMFGGTLWALVWDSEKADFDARQVFDFATLDAGIALEMYFNDAMDRLYVTTGNPGEMHIFDVGGDIAAPKHLNRIKTAAGAHHVAITKDESLAFVQNALLNLPGLSEGSIKVVDLKAEKVIASMDTLVDVGLHANSIVLLPEWNSLAGH